MHEFQSLLARWEAGDPAARDRLISLIHDEVNVIASAVLRRNAGPASMVTDDLVNEAFLKLIQSETVSVTSRAHLLALCARIMRFILIDRLREKGAAKRHGDAVTLMTNDGAGDPDVEARALNAALLRLQAISPDRARIVEMRYFGGMTLEEIAEVTGVSEATVKRSWRVTRAWLKEAILGDFA